MEMDVSTEQSTFQWQDYVVIGVVLSIFSGIGLYYRFTGGRQRTVEEYFSADRSMNIVPLAMALMVSYTSAITLLGVSAENYAYGALFASYYIVCGIGMVLVTHLYLPVFFELHLMSVFEYLEMRFGVCARLVASCANFLNLMLYTGMVLLAPSLALEATTGLSTIMSVSLIGVICTFYSTIGGIKAVLITDVFQAVLMFASISCILGVAHRNIDGGLSNVWHIAYEGNRVDFNSFSFDPTVRHTWWGIILNSIIMTASLYGVNQVQVQRLLTVKTLADSKKALYLNYPIVVAMGLITSYSGLVLYAVYKDCDPLASQKIDSMDKIMPFFVADKMSRFPGLTGLFVSGIFSAALSTISAMLNSLSAIMLEDYVKPAYKKLGGQFPQERATLIGKIFALLNGSFCTMLAILAADQGSLLETTLSVMGVMGGPMLGIFSLGMFFENANEAGAVAGLVCSVVTGLWMSYGSYGSKQMAPQLPVSVDGCDNSTIFSANSTAPGPEEVEDGSTDFYLYRISYVWYTPLGVVLTIAIGYSTSLIARRLFAVKNRKPDPRLFSPIVASRIRRRQQDASNASRSQVFVLEPSSEN